MIKKAYILIFVCLPLFGLSQSDFNNTFKTKLATLSADSVFMAIDQRVDYLTRSNSNPESVIDLLEFKLEIADSLNNQFERLQALLGLLDHPNQFDTESYFHLLNKTAQTQSRLGNTDESMSTYFEAAHLADSINNDTLLADIYNNIGTAYKKQGNAILSLKYLRESLHFNEIIKDTVGIIGNYMTIGNAYKLQKEDNSLYADTALFFYNKSLSLSLNHGYQRGVAGNYNNIGNIYRYQNKLQESLNQFFLALEINLAAENDQWVSFNYHNIGMTYQELDNHRSALTYLEKSLAIKQKLGNQQEIAETYNSIAVSMAALGRFKEAYEYEKKAKSLRDELQSDERNRLSQELEARFQNEKKEAEISKLMAEQNLQSLIIEEKQKDLDHQSQLRSREKYLIYALGVILLSLIITVFVFWRNSRQRKKYTETLKLKNSEIEQVNTQIDLARVNLELKNQEITDSINYAKRIQAAILPSEKTLSENLNKAFVLYLPKDIVAGDFYWTEKVGNHIIFAVADCTGHGVPGAMVSVICHNALNSTTKQLGLTDPGEILDETTRLVLAQFEKSEEEVRDGMDIALCSFDTESRNLKYAGAHTPLWLVRNETILKFDATRQPVGNHTKRVKFKSNTVEIQKGDVIYLSSDGYTDQFGGEKGKKFMSKRFKELLIEAAKLPITEQQALLYDRFQIWKRTYDQVDDVCLLGVRVEE